MMRAAKNSGVLRGLAVALWLALVSPAIAQETKNVLVFYGNTAELPWVKAFDAALRPTVTGATRHRVNFYTEYFDVARFPEPMHQEAFVNLMRARYADRKVDVMVMGGATAFDFLISRRKSVLPDVPFVYSFLPPDQVEAPTFPPDVVGVPVDFGPMPTIELALRLHPHARRLVLVTGSGGWDLAWEKRLRQETTALRTRMEVDFLARLPTEEVYSRLRALPKDAIVFTPGFFTDGAGVVVTPRDVVEGMAANSPAPVYVAYETYVGTGAVGGVLPTFGAVARQTGEIAAALLEGKQPAELKLPRVVRGTALVDWRQLRRWGLDEDLLPPGTEVRFREPSLWAQYQREISIGVLVVVLQAALIAALLVQRRGRRRISLALEKSEERMSLAAHAARQDIWFWEVEGDTIRATAPLRSATGRPKEWSGDAQKVLDTVHPADRDRVRQAALEAIGNGAEFNVEYRVLGADGAARWIAARGRPQKQSGRQLLGVALDITERKTAELEAARDRANLRQLARESMLGQLSAAIAHQVNQPLAAILGNAEAAQKMLGRDKVDLVELRAICDDIVAEDQRAAEVIRRLRDLYKRGEIVRERCDLNELVREITELLRAELMARNVVAVTELAPQLPPISADGVQLQQVLLNLMLNAADAMSEGAEGQKVVTIRTERSGGGILLSVIDHGRGIAVDDLKKVFDGFWGTKPGGMGMGLAICKTIVEAHGGSLKASNNSGGGACFCASLPMEAPA